MTENLIELHALGNECKRMELTFLKFMYRGFNILHNMAPFLTQYYIPT